MNLIDFLNWLMMKKKMTASQDWYGDLTRSDIPGRGSSNQFDFFRQLLPEQTNDFSPNAERRFPSLNKTIQM